MTKDIDLVHNFTCNKWGTTDLTLGTECVSRSHNVSNNTSHQISFELKWWKGRCYKFLQLSMYIPYHTIPYHTTPYHTIPHHTTPYHTIPYHTTPYYTTTPTSHLLETVSILPQLPKNQIQRMQIILLWSKRNQRIFHKRLHIFLVIRLNTNHGITLMLFDLNIATKFRTIQFILTLVYDVKIPRRKTGIIALEIICCFSSLLRARQKRFID